MVEGFEVVKSLVEFEGDSLEEIEEVVGFELLCFHGGWVFIFKK